MRPKKDDGQRYRIDNQPLRVHWPLPGKKTACSPCNTRKSIHAIRAPSSLMEPKREFRLSAEDATKPPPTPMQSGSLLLPIKCVGARLSLTRRPCRPAPCAAAVALCPCSKEARDDVSDMHSSLLVVHARPHALLQDGGASSDVPNYIWTGQAVGLNALNRHDSFWNTNVKYRDPSSKIQEPVRLNPPQAETVA